MGQQLSVISQDSISADEKSLYRALRRFEAMGVVESSWQPSEVGPRRRYYALTDLGGELLRQFAQRNILIFREPAVAERLGAMLGE
jgi:DNA-binding PadR family transcriptional regulator